MAAALLAVPGQAGLAVDSTSSELDAGAEVSVVDVETATLTDLREQLASLTVANGALLDENVALSDVNVGLQADNDSLAQTVDGITRERDRLADSIRHFDDLYDPLEADRQLLFELRKGLPETRGEAEAQLERIERLALTSNPARLGQLVDRVAENAPAFLDWRFQQFSSTQEASAAYIQTGANAFDSSMQDLRNAVLLSVANRLDGLLNVIDRVR